ncbi:hypothetical protein [Luteirhabdus pelagi]|uniref:hypothetical protein n=1 Tax=Luteirhabdus pelagi TaxID=2792783 RepID=UPI00193A1634|nr:hypothetical protein [Luteirhabdus pelagi]
MAKKNRRKIFDLTAIMTLLGVIVGGLITGFFANKSQKELLEFQKEQFLNEYRISKNSEIKNGVENYIDNLTELLINGENMNEKEQDSLFSLMYSNSIKMSLLRDISIGSNSLNLTLELRKNRDKINQHDSITHSLIGDWITSVKTEMLMSDYGIDKKEITEDLIQVMLNKK